MINRRRINIWESVSDMMTGMMMIFLFVSLAFMLQHYSTRAQIVADLTKEFPPSELADMHATIDEKSGTISFNADGAVLFVSGQEIPSYEYQKILNDFFPRYINILQKDKYKGKIAEIRIEGHASIEKNESYDNQYQYFDNMRRSQGRARNVLEYVMRMPIYKDKEHQDWLKQHIIAVGYSFSKSTGDTTKDRRVDFRVVLNAEKPFDKNEELSE